ncbi:MAG: hypothetical protein AAF899_10530 [Pseudomonadota bacterium]
MTHADSPQPTPPGIAALSTGRVHEATGPGRRTFAAAIAGEGSGPVLWIMDARIRDALYPAGLAPLLDPARLVIARPTGPLASLQVAEEALRSGAVPMVVTELEAAPDLTESRRLQLAAGTGGGRGLCLVPEGRLATNAAETRWYCSPMHGGMHGARHGGRDARLGGVAEGTLPRRASETQASLGALQHWELLKNKRGPLAAWQVTLSTPSAARLDRGAWHRPIGAVAATAPQRARA